MNAALQARIQQLEAENEILRRGLSADQIQVLKGFMIAAAEISSATLTPFVAVVDAMRGACSWVFAKAARPIQAGDLVAECRAAETLLAELIKELRETNFCREVDDDFIREVTDRYEKLASRNLLRTWRKQ